MKIKVTSDSTCDLSPELLAQNDITLLPLTVVMDGRNYSDGVDITPLDIFRHVAAGGGMCSTAAVNVASYYEHFQKNLAGYDALIHVNISAEFSSCHQNACIAAQEFPNVYVIDSRNLSTGHGHVVLETCKLARTGMDPAQIVAEINDLTPRVDASFLLDQLGYMVKGGRCSSVAALGANLLHLKPCIEVVGGKMRVGKKYRGSYAKCLSAYVKDRLDGRDDIIPERIFVTHTEQTGADSIDAATQAVRQYGNFEHIYETVAGCTVSCHCGPSTLGILYIHKKP